MVSERIVTLLQILLVAMEEDLKAGSKVFQTFLAVAKVLKGEVVFVTVDLGGSYKDAVVDYFGLNEEDAPIVSAPSCTYP
jgi:hypothetical protein